MIVLSEIFKNQIIKIPVVKRFAKKRHVTGINQAEDGVVRIVDMYKKYIDFNGKDVVELGPGQTYGVACKIKEAGANSVSIIDIEKYIPDEILQKYSYLDYIIYNGNEMPLADESFDLAISNTVYEHLRNPEKTVSETYRILRKGGKVVHLVDLCDHMFYGSNKNKNKVFNCLRYSRRVWNMMSCNRSIYVNRLRQSEWVSMHEKQGFTILHKEITMNEHVKDLFTCGNLKYLSKYKPEDRFASSILLVAEK